LNINRSIVTSNQASNVIWVEGDPLHYNEGSTQQKDHALKTSKKPKHRQF